MALLFEKSASWRWLVQRTKDSKPFFYTFATVCGVIPGIIGYGVMTFTSSTDPALEAKLRQKARPETVMMANSNKEWLAEYFGELQRKENTNDRYVAALRGETLTRKPYVRIQPMPKPDDPQASTQPIPKQNVAQASTQPPPKQSDSQANIKPIPKQNVPEANIKPIPKQDNPQVSK